MEIGFIDDGQPMDVIVSVDGDKVTVELDVRNNDRVTVGDDYIVEWDDGAVSILCVTSIKSADQYTPTLARRVDAMREGVVGPPATVPARKAYQTKLAVMTVRGELSKDGARRIGAARLPNVMLPVKRISDDQLESFVTNAEGNVVVGRLRSGNRILNQVGKINHNYAGERMIILGNTGMGKTQFLRSLLSQAMSED